MQHQTGSQKTQTRQSNPQRPRKDRCEGGPCLWMQAGVVSRKTCNHHFDCNSCRYDKGMQKQVDKGRLQSWQNVMRKRSGLNRICRHSLTGRIPSRICAYDYRCNDCDFDQFFEDIWSHRTRSRIPEIENVKGFNVPRDRYFHEGHTWARIEDGGFLRVGLDDFSLKTLGQLSALDLPLMGKELVCGEAGWGLKRKDDTADVLSPVNGVIVDVNPKVREAAGTANQDPYGEGWLFTVHHPDLKSAVAPLMNDEAGIEWTHSEVQTLENLIEQTCGPMATDGGYFTHDIFGNLPDLGWDRLVRTFLKTG